MSKNAEIYAKVFESVIAEMEQGRAPWVKPWRDLGGRGDAMPYNAVTGRRYSGGNIVALWFAGMAYDSNGWVTFKQALSADCVVRKGEKGTAVFFMSVLDKKAKAGEEEAPGKPSRMFFAKAFTVFNVEQLDELKPGALDTLRNKHRQPAGPVVVSEVVRNAAADAMIDSTGARITHGGSSACFVPSLDVIRMPIAGSFDSADSYYGTLFHELVHWTGHEARLNRIVPAAFGSPDYAFEELVAELGAAFCSATFGYNGITQSAAYLRHWAAKCRETPDLLVKAASLASKALEFLAPATAGDEVEEPAALAA